jgi:predicted DNA-binding ribbon-helix-helix protein
VKTCIHKIYNELKPTIIDEIRGVHAAVTTDIWTSVAHDRYITITCHYITNHWELKARILATRIMKEQHTVSNIADVIRVVCQEFQLGSVVAITTDNASTMVSCGKKWLMMDTPGAAASHIHYNCVLQQG